MAIDVLQAQFVRADYYRYAPCETEHFGCRVFGHCAVLVRVQREPWEHDNGATGFWEHAIVDVLFPWPLKISCNGEPAELIVNPYESLSSLQRVNLMADALQEIPYDSDWHTIREAYYELQDIPVWSPRSPDFMQRLHDFYTTNLAHLDDK